MVYMERKIKRDKLRREVGNRGLKKAWRRYQIKKYKLSYKRICIETQK